MASPSSRNDQIVHVNIPCLQLERAQAFYRGAFGILFFIQVGDIARTLADACRVGARVVTEKRAVGGPGFHAVFADTVGNRVGLFRDN